MTRPFILEHNVETDTVIEREMNDEEYAQFEIDQQAKLERDAELEKAKADKAALLSKLGITADEAKLLLGQ